MLPVRARQLAPYEECRVSSWQWLLLSEVNRGCFTLCGCLIFLKRCWWNRHTPRTLRPVSRADLVTDRREGPGPSSLSTFSWSVLLLGHSRVQAAQAEPAASILGRWLSMTANTATWPHRGLVMRMRQERPPRLARTESLSRNCCTQVCCRFPTRGACQDAREWTC